MDLGIAASQSGKDVKFTADRFFTLSSSFQSLKVLAVHEVSTTIPALGTNTITITHNLGYYAPVIVVYNGSTSAGQGTSYFMSDSIFPLNLEVSTNTIKINVSDEFDVNHSSSGDTVYFTVYSFIDTFDSFTAPVLSTDTTDSTDGNDYGFRVSKPYFDVKTCSDLDCIITSKRQSMTVHKKGVDTTGSVSHGLGYIPTFLGFVKFSGDSFLQLASDFSAVNTSTVDCTLDTGDEFYYVIFKQILA